MGNNRRRNAIKVATSGSVKPVVLTQDHQILSQSVGIIKRRRRERVDVILTCMACACENLTFIKDDE